MEIIKMKIALKDLKAGDRWEDEVVEKVYPADGNAHIVFESGRTFVMAEDTLITIEREAQDGKETDK